MFKTINDGIMPTRATQMSAGVDLCANEYRIIEPRSTAIIPLGVVLNQENLIARGIDIANYYLSLEPRSSLRAKGIIGCTGIIDIDYNKELKIILHNFTDKPFIIHTGDRIAQAVVLKHYGYITKIKSDVVRDGGFGSTGK